jgi:hypothetical protein
MNVSIDGVWLCVHDEYKLWNRNSFTREAPEFNTGFQWGPYCSIFSFLCKVVYIVVDPFVFVLFGYCNACREEFGDTTKKSKQHNGQKKKYKRTNNIKNTHETKNRVTIYPAYYPVNVTYSEWQTVYYISDKHIKITKTKTKHVETYKLLQWNKCEI